MKTRIKELATDYNYVESVEKGLITTVSIQECFDDTTWYEFEDIVGESPVKIILMTGGYSCDDASDFEGMMESEVLAKFNTTTYGATPDGAVILPVFQLSHGGDCFSTTDFNDPWDSWLAGFAYVSKEDCVSMLGKNTDDIIKMIRRRVEEFSSYANGTIYEVVKTEISADYVDNYVEAFLVLDDDYNQELELLDETGYETVDAVVEKFGEETGLAMIAGEVRNKDTITDALADKSKDYLDGFKACAEMFNINIKNIIK